MGGVIRGEYIGGEILNLRYKKQLYHAFGFPVEGQLFYTPFNNLGFGLSLFANFNSKIAYKGFMLSFKYYIF